MPFDISQLQSKFDDFDRRVEAACVAACEEFAELVLTKSKDLCPVSPTDPKHPLHNGHSGQLRDSGTTKDAVVSGDLITVEMGYNTNYAAAVHERLDLNHRYPGAVNSKAQAKYLEAAIRGEAPKLPEYVAKRVREELGA